MCGGIFIEAILKDKRQEELTKDLLVQHVEYLKQLSQNGFLKLCGPFVDNEGACMVLNGVSLEDVKRMLNHDPFIREGYYGNYEVKEFIEASDENNWLMDIPQTQGNLKD
ncbi:MAG: hypothetical protein H0Z33_16095 [Bacillaceae bacterium]|nr:hypothetical protein [Bacillaceae bacterium]